MNQLETGKAVAAAAALDGGGVEWENEKEKCGEERESSERAGLKRCRTLTNLNATCFKLCQSEQETATLETSYMMALKPKRRDGNVNPLSSKEPSFYACLFGTLSAVK